MSRIISAIALVFVVAAGPVMAGVVDSPVPAPFKQHVFTVLGLIHNGVLGTYFFCTNLDAAAVTIGVELFGQAGGDPANDAAASSLTVQPGATALFGTGTPNGFFISSFVPAGGTVEGSARILATSKKLACTAFVADRLNNPPETSWQLTIIAKTKQKACN